MEEQTQPEPEPEVVVTKEPSGTKLAWLRMNQQRKDRGSKYVSSKFK